MFGLPTSAIAGAALLALTLAFASGYATGHGHAMDKADAERLDAVQRAIRQAAAIEADNLEVAMTEAATQEQIRTVYRTIDREVIRYVQAHPDRPECDLPDRGVRLIRCALAGPECEGGSGAVDPVPAPAAVGERDELRAAASHGSPGAPVLGVPDTASGPGGLGTQPGGPG